MNALDIASSDGDIAPFASFVAGLVSEQTLAPLPLESRQDA
jgi:hypothetical protein